MTHSPRTLHTSAVIAVGALTAALTACTTPAAQENETPSSVETSTTVELGAAAPRLALTYDGGIQVLDATTLEVITDLPLHGFNRLSPAGDERHAIVSTAGGFQVLDLGNWAEAHGDHAHYYATDPALLDVRFPAEAPGHVVAHHGRTALFDDATGTVTVVDAAAVADPDAESRTHTSPAAHHGVAVELSDGTLVISEGTADGRTGAVALDTTGTQIAASSECPGLHGEAVTEDETVVLGCEDGALVFHDGQFAKLTAPDAFGRIGNLRAAAGSDIVLGDYNADPDGGPLTQIALIDTHDGEITVVDLGTEYTFRSLARDDHGHALLLGADGAIHVIDPESGAVESVIPVIDPWQVPAEWQEPRPTLITLAGSAYVTDPSQSRVLAVDVPTEATWLEAQLAVTPNEITGASGNLAEGADHDHDHDHEDHDH